MAFSPVTGHFLLMIRGESWSWYTHSQFHEQVGHFKSMWEIKYQMISKKLNFKSTSVLSIPMEIAHSVEMYLDCHCLVKYGENASWRSIIKVKKKKMQWEWLSFMKPNQHLGRVYGHKNGQTHSPEPLVLNYHHLWLVM